MSSNSDTKISTFFRPIGPKQSSFLRYSVDPVQAERVICHRRHPDSDSVDRVQYLVRWTVKHCLPEDAPVSWHDGQELVSCLGLVQSYIEWHKKNRLDFVTVSDTQRHQRDNKSTGSLAHGSTCDHASEVTGRRQSFVTVSSLDSSEDEDTTTRTASRAQSILFNATFQKRGGHLIVVPSRLPTVPKIDTTILPTAQMLSDSISVDTIAAEIKIRRSYEIKLDRVPGPALNIVNPIDRLTPSLAFHFVKGYVYHAKDRSNQDFILGCTQCSERGCEDPNECECLECAAPDESAMSTAQRIEWNQRIAQGSWESKDMPKRFPYYTSGPRRGCLVDFYLKTRHMIYECNNLCGCGPGCRNRNVQHGRQVGLQIFKTADRGFGLKCTEDLKAGQFIDTYRGEVVSDEEATRREDAVEHSAAHYLFALDKFVGDKNDDNAGGIRRADSLIVDGRNYGGPSRFINHSCAPNIQMHAVSYSKYDQLIYDLAFFAADDIEANTELTFDYMEKGDVGDAALNGLEPAPMSSSQQQDHRDAERCRCGAPNCRGLLWV